MGDPDDDLNALRQQVRDLEQRIEDLNVFTSLVAHDIDAPARRIAAFVDLLERDHTDGLDETGRSYLDFVGSGARRLRELIITLLHFSQLGEQALDPEPIDVNEVVRTVLEDLADVLVDRSVSVDVRPVPPVLATGPLVGFILRRMISDAVRRSADQPLAVVIHGDSVETGTVSIHVDDDVPGAATTYHEGIVDSTHRRHRRDHGPRLHGLGEATASRIVDAMGGSMSFSSSGTGSSSTVRLPAAPG